MGSTPQIAQGHLGSPTEVIDCLQFSSGKAMVGPELAQGPLLSAQPRGAGASWKDSALDRADLTDKAAG